MTAERWWVRWAARWLARVDGVKAHIQVASLVVTGFSTFSLVLQNAGHGRFVRPLAVALLIGLPIYTYLYTEGGVWNQVSRDREDLSRNFADPTMLLNMQIQARQLAYLAARLEANGQFDRDELEADLKAITEAEWADLRDGINIEAVKQE